IFAQLPNKNFISGLNKKYAHLAKNAGCDGFISISIVTDIKNKLVLYNSETAQNEIIHFPSPPRHPMRDDPEMRELISSVYDIAEILADNMMPYMYEDIYRRVLLDNLIYGGFHVESKKQLPAVIDSNMPFCNIADLVIDNKLIIQIKTSFTKFVSRSSINELMRFQTPNPRMYCIILQFYPGGVELYEYEPYVKKKK
ncbi:MAG: hypothetical protein KDH96_06860, partial [Candidatus Riesia sp.]|nr:hypothetical protein [Candidatus Riesia sp.]